MDFSEDDFDNDFFDNGDGDGSDNENGDNGGYNSDNFADEQEFKPSIKDIERVSLPDACGGVTIQLNNWNDMQKSINQQLVDPLDRFKAQIGGISYRLDNEDIFNIPREIRNKLCEKADTLEKVKYLNPMAFILGYLATNGGQQMDKKKIMNVLNNLSVIDDETITKPDVVRYSRYWMKIS
jgi:hypothetical protein